MMNRFIQYAIGIFVGVAIYRLVFKNEIWLTSLIAAAFVSGVTTLCMYFYMKWKSKKSA